MGDELGLQSWIFDMFIIYRIDRRTPRAPRTNHAIICLYYYPQKVCNFHV